MTRALFVVLLLSVHAARADEEHCPRGTRTALTIQAQERREMLRPDEAIGGDVLSLHAGKRELMHAVSHDFHWMCLSYSKKRGHLVGTQAAMNGAIVLRTIGYLAEDAQVIEPSAFTRERLHAYAALPSRDGRFVAFVGGREETALYLLDTLRDQVRKLGPAPAPPPDPERGCADWGPGCVTGFTELSPKIWSFSGSALVVSYGAGRQRRLRRFKL